jgi:hypothetical protein
MVVFLIRAEVVVVTAITTTGEDRAGAMEEEDSFVAGQQGEVGVVEVGIGLWSMSRSLPPTQLIRPSVLQEKERRG